ncbi:hypothetical protein Tco_0262302, partial [Tanacetum coccineum]
MLSLYMRSSTEVSIDIVIHEIYSGGDDVRSQDGIAIHEMFNGGVDMVSLYMRCSMEESR